MTSLAPFRLRLEEEGAVDDDLLASAKTGEDLDLTCEVTPATDAPDLEVAVVLGQEDGPLVAYTLNRGDGNRQDWCAGAPDGDSRARRHAGPEQSAAIPNIDPDRNGLGLLFNMASDHRHITFEVLTGQCRERETCRHALADTDGISLERDRK